MNIGKMLFALHVRTFALEKRSSARSAFYAIIFEHPELERQKELEAWENEYSIEFFISQSLDEIRQTARLIDYLNKCE